MTEEDLKLKHYVKQPDGSWAKPATVYYKDPITGALSSASVIDRQLAPQDNPMCEVSKPGVFSGEAKRKRIRQDSKPLLNKLEKSFWTEYLEFRYPKAKPQALKFKLGNGIAYKPDFVDLSVQPVKAWEVKGPHAFRGGFENLKVAASLYPEVRWILVWKESGTWQHQEVMP